MIGKESVVFKQTNSFFIDSNIFLYPLLNQDPEKTLSCLVALSLPHVFISTQVINEICSNLIKKTDYTENDINSLINKMYRKYKVTQIKKITLLASSHLRKKYSLQFWDSMLVASALECNCDFLLSEDMQNGLSIKYDTKQIIISNPFK